VTLVDHGAGKSYLGFILYDLFFKQQPGHGTPAFASHVYGIETREELVTRSAELAARLGFGGMSFLNLSVADSITSPQLPETVDVVTRCMRAIRPPTMRSASRSPSARSTSCWCRAVRRKSPACCARTRASRSRMR
jgi:hypothetical protein